MSIKNIGHNFLYSARGQEYPDFNLSLIMGNSVSYIEADSFNILSYLEPTLNYDKDKVAYPLLTVSPSILSASCEVLGSVILTLETMQEK